MNLQKVNLNLLVHLELLLEEQSVTRAAERAYITQTAMSNILKQLRELFDDALLVRVGRKLQPTPKALELQVSLQRCLHSIDQVFEDCRFEPAKDEMTFKIAIHSHGEYMILPLLVEFLSTNAPGIALHAVSLSELLNIDGLLANEIDLAIAPGFINTGNEILSESLFNEKASCVMHPSNPLSNKTLTQEGFLQAEHVDVKFGFNGRENILDSLLYGMGVRRNIKVIVPNMLSAIRILENTNYIVTLPNHIVHSIKDTYELIIKPFPYPLQSFKVKVFYHHRVAKHPPLQWLISQIKTLTSKNDEAE